MKYSIRSKGQFTTKTKYALQTLLLGLKELSKVRWIECTCLAYLIAIPLTIANDAYKPLDNTIHYALAEEVTPPVASSTPIIIEVRIDWTTARIEQEIRATFPEDPDVAVAVAKAESGHLLKPTAYNPEWHRTKSGVGICQGSFGVMQVGCIHMKRDPEALYDIHTNLEVARKLYEAEGWKPWGGYTNGSYLKFL